jgi:stage II sporulation protein D
MKKLALFLVVCIPFCGVLNAGLWSSFKSAFGYEERVLPPNIRVLIVHDLDKVHLEVNGPYSLYDPYTNSHITSRFVGKARLIQAMSDGLKWGESFPGLYQLKISPVGENALIQVEDRQYTGVMYVYDIGQSISLVNQVPVEDYIKSVLRQDEIDRLHPETLAALAIAARTNTYFQSVNPKNTFWAVDAKKVNYEGVIDSNKAIDEAVNATRYMIMSRTGTYEGVATPFGLEFGPIGVSATQEVAVSQISLEEAEKMAQRGEHAAQILAKAFPGSIIMLMCY